MRHLLTDQPQRVIFGGRLASIKDGPGSWACGLEPDSVVLFTEPAGPALCCPALTDEGGLATLRRQHGWVLASRARFQAVGKNDSGVTGTFCRGAGFSW